MSLPSSARIVGRGNRPSLARCSSARRKALRHRHQHPPPPATAGQPLRDRLSQPLGNLEERIVGTAFEGCRRLVLGKLLEHLQDKGSRRPPDDAGQLAGNIADFTCRRQVKLVFQCLFHGGEQFRLAFGDLLSGNPLQGIGPRTGFHRPGRRDGKVLDQAVEIGGQVP